MFSIQIICPIIGKIEIQTKGGSVNRQVQFMEINNASKQFIILILILIYFTPPSNQNKIILKLNTNHAHQPTGRTGGKRLLDLQ